MHKADEIVRGTADRGSSVYSRGERARFLVSEYGIVIVIVALGALFGLTAPRFLLAENIVTILKQISVVRSWQSGCSW